MLQCRPRRTDPVHQSGHILLRRIRKQVAAESIAKAFAPEALIGRQVVVVANLAPRDFGKGMISHGMLLAAGPKEGLTLAGFDKHVPPGTRVK